jgi:hypothetical protein
MTEHKDQLALPRALRALDTSVVPATKLAYQVPQCKLVQDFLVSHNLPWQAFYMPFAFPREEKRELSACLQALFNGMKAERSRLCGLYGVATEEELPHDHRTLFDAALHAFVVREDHYP